MKLIITLLAVMLCFNNNAAAQKNKKNKNKNKIDSTRMVMEAPMIVEDVMVTDVPYDMVAPPVEDRPLVDYYGSGKGTNEPYSNVLKSGDKKIFDAEKGFYKISKISGNYITKYGIEDSTGKNILPVLFSDIRDADKNDLIKVRAGDLCGLYDRSFKNIFPIEYEEIQLIALPGKNWYLLKNPLNQSIVVSKAGVQQIPGMYKSISMIAISKYGDSCRLKIIQGKKQYTIVNNKSS